MEVIEVSLNKANRLVERLKGLLKTYKRSRYDDTVTIDVSFSFESGVINDTSAFLKNVTDTKEERSATLENYLGLYEDMLALKEQLFRENVLSGLSEVLGQIELQKKKIEVYEGILKDIKDKNLTFEATNPADVKQIESHNALVNHNGEQRELKFSVFDEEKIRQDLLEATKTLTELGDKKETFNSKKKVTVSIHTSTKLNLGL